MWLRGSPELRRAPTASEPLSLDAGSPPLDRVTLRSLGSVAPVKNRLKLTLGVVLLIGAIATQAFTVGHRRRAAVGPSDHLGVHVGFPARRHRVDRLRADPPSRT